MIASRIVLDVATEKRPLREDLRALAGAPRELWLVLAAKTLESAGYFSLVFTVVLWLSQDLGMSDVRAGWWVGVFSIALTIFTFLAGFTADAVGVRPALIAAFTLSAIARAGMAVATGPAVAVGSLLLLAAGVSGGVPVMNAAIRRYTTVRNRSFAFALYYLTYNIGGAAAGFLIDAARDRFPAPGEVLRAPLLGEVTMSAWRAIYLVGFGLAAASLLIALFLRGDIEAEALPGPPPEKKGPIAIAIEVMREPSFLRFMVFIGLLSIVRMIFNHHQFTFPKYVLREMGDRFPLGKIDAIDPVLILFLVPLVTALTRRRSVFTTIVVGAFITSGSVLIFCLGASWATIIGFMVLLAAGEAMWAPRFYEYAATIAPRGREASYLGLSAIPQFLAKLAAGPMSGYLLATYCPAEGARRSWILWGIIGLTTLVGPVLLLALRGFIEGRREA